MAASSHLADHGLDGAQGHVEGDVGRMVEVGCLGHYLLDALGCIHVGRRGLVVDDKGMLWWWGVDGNDEACRDKKTLMAGDSSSPLSSCSRCD